MTDVQKTSTLAGFNGRSYSHVTNVLEQLAASMITMRDFARAAAAAEGVDRRTEIEFTVLENLAERAGALADGLICNAIGGPLDEWVCGVDSTSMCGGMQQ